MWVIFGVPPTEALRAGGKRRRRCALPAHSVRFYCSLAAFGSIDGRAGYSENHPYGVYADTHSSCKMKAGNRNRNE